jgi:creatinine amidohydrolase/Fe(II)-dependent formamide hydrolase-like protein
MGDERLKQTGPEIRFRSKDALMALITVGGMRDHGPHLSAFAEYRILKHYGEVLGDRFYPYVLLTEGVPYCLQENTIVGLTADSLVGAIRDIANSVKILRVGKVLAITLGAGELQSIKKAFDVVEGIKKYAVGIWELYPSIEVLKTEDPLAKGGPHLTSQTMYLDGSYVKTNMFKYADSTFGITCDPSKSSSELGKTIVEKVTESLVAYADKIMRD